MLTSPYLFLSGPGSPVVSLRLVDLFPYFCLGLWARAHDTHLKDDSGLWWAFGSQHLSRSKPLNQLFRPANNQAKRKEVPIHQGLICDWHLVRKSSLLMLSSTQGSYWLHTFSLKWEETKDGFILKLFRISSHLAVSERSASVSLMLVRPYKLIIFIAE